MNINMVKLISLASSMKTNYDAESDTLILTFGKDFKPEDIYIDNSMVDQGIIVKRLKKGKDIVFVKVENLKKVLSDPRIKETLASIPKPILSRLLNLGGKELPIEL